MFLCFYLNCKHAHSARYLLTNTYEPDVERRANTQPRERVAVLAAAGVAAGAADAVAGHKRDQHAQHEVREKRVEKPQVRRIRERRRGKSHERGLVTRESRVADFHCSETKGHLS